MGKRTSIYLSAYDEQRLTESGKSLIDVLRMGFDAMDLQADLAKIPLPGISKVEAAALANPEVRAAIAAAKTGDRSDPLRQRTRRERECKHPPARVHKGLCSACGQGGV